MPTEDIVDHQDSISVIPIAGPLDLFNAYKLGEVLLARTRNDIWCIALDLTLATEISQTGMGILKRERTRCRNAGGDLVIILPADHKLLSTFQTTKMDMLFDIFPCQADARNYLKEILKR